MQQIDFHFHVRNRSLYACKLLKKLYGLKLTAVVWSTDRLLLKRVYDDLWRFDDLAFIPHAWSDAPEASQSPIVFGSDLEALPKNKVIVLLDENVPNNWQQALAPYDRVVDIVSTDPEELTHARARYRIYKAAGVTLKAYDRSKG